MQNEVPYIKPHRRQPRDAIRKLLQSFTQPAKPPDLSVPEEQSTFFKPQKRAD